MKEEERRKTVRRLAVYTSIIFLLPSSLLAGYLIGYLLDGWLGTSPWLSMLFLLLGGAAGLYQVFRMVGSD